MRREDENTHATHPLRERNTRIRHTPHCHTLFVSPSSDPNITLSATTEAFDKIEHQFAAVCTMALRAASDEVMCMHAAAVQRCRSAANTGERPEGSEPQDAAWLGLEDL